jgi:hypothetical protein
MATGRRDGNLLRWAAFRRHTQGKRRSMQIDQASDMSLTDTDTPVVARDHMGRRHVETVREAFIQDLPWIIALVVLITFVISTMGGYIRL